MERLPKLGLPIIIGGIILLIILAKSFIVISAGSAGVLYKITSGVVTDKPPLGEGLHLVAPWNRVIHYEVRQQELPEKLNVLSTDGLNIGLQTSIWFRPEYSNLGKLHQEKGERYISRILKPALEAAARNVIGRYTPEQLYSSKRSVIENEIEEDARERLEGQYIDLVKVQVSDVSLPPTIKDAIERKLSMEQQALEYEFRLISAEKEAERQRIEAEGKSRANNILNASLTDRLLKEKGIRATTDLAESPNAKVVVIGGDDGLPLILGGN